MLDKIARALARVFFDKLLTIITNRKLICLLIKSYTTFHPYLDSSTRSVLKDINNKAFGEDLTLKVTNTGLIQVFTENWVYLYYGGNKSKYSLEVSSANYLHLKGSKVAQLVDYNVDYDVEANDIVSAYCRVERLKNLPHDEKYHAKGVVLSLFNKASDYALYPIQDLTAIIKMLEKQLDFNFTDFIEHYKLRDIHLQFGLSHGDLTPNNIMKNTQGNYVLIDLDRFSSDRELSFDDIHFDIEQNAASSNWLIALKERLDSIETDKLGNLSLEHSVNLLYFIRRLSLELEGDNTFVQSYKRHILSFLSSF